MALSRDELRERLAAHQFRSREVDVPGLGTVEVFELSATEQTNVGALMAQFVRPGMSQSELIRELMNGNNIGTMGPVMLKAAAYGLKLGEEAIEDLDRMPELVQIAAVAAFELSGMTAMSALVENPKKNSQEKRKAAALTD